MKDELSWLGEEPIIDEKKIAHVIYTDIVVAGGGLAGVAAVREAAELGARVVLFEKCGDIQARSGDFAIWDSKVAKTWNRQNLDKEKAVATLMKDMCYRVDQRILKTWIDNAGEAFDWYLEGFPETKILKRTDEAVEPGTRCWIQPRRYPLPDGYDMEKEYYPCFPTTVWVHPTHIPIHRGNFNLAMGSGKVTSFFYTPVVKLLKNEEGRMIGVIAQKSQGEYVCAYAKKGVILSTGDYMSDDRMLYHYCPQTRGIPRFWTSFDKDKKPSNTGDGQRMGMWAGAVMDNHPHAPMTHHMGGVVGTSDFLLLNKFGERFVNEDCPGQQLDNQIRLQPGEVVWQFFDSNWKEYIPKVTANHGAVCMVLEEEDVKTGKVNPALSQIDSYVSEEIINRAVEKGKLIKGDTLEELIERLGLPQKNTLKEIERYNQICAKGHDEDFGKEKERLFPVQKAPFYASRFEAAGMLVCLGGLKSDQYNRCYDKAGEIIPGLYCAGNTQGGRFSVEYPTTVPGLSHSMALTLGRMAGRNAVEEK